MDHLFANFWGKPAAPSTPTLAADSPKPKKRQISPTPVSAPATSVAATTSIAEGGESAKKVKLEQSEQKKELPVVTDAFETEAKREVGGNVGLGGGEAEGLILSHAVRISPFFARTMKF